MKKDKSRKRVRAIRLLEIRNDRFPELSNNVQIGETFTVISKEADVVFLFNNKNKKFLHLNKKEVET